jgi:hypothetical protein
MGPNLIYHLGGGPGGIHHFLEQFAGPIAAGWADLGSPDLGPELQKKMDQHFATRKCHYLGSLGRTVQLGQVAPLYCRIIG